MSRLIALAGRAGSGKNTVARLLGAREISFAEPLKRICQEVFAFSDAQMFGPSEERNRPDPRYPRADGQCLTPRYALQTLGTEWGRNCFDGVWADLGVRRALEALALGRDVVITDCRFVNEAKAVRLAGGEVWRIYRPEAEAVASTHPSEMEMNTPEFRNLVTREIQNTGTLDQLRDALLQP